MRLTPSHMGASSSRPPRHGGAAPPPPGFDPATGQYAQPVVYQQVSVGGSQDTGRWGDDRCTTHQCIAGAISRPPSPVTPPTQQPPAGHHPYYGAHYYGAHYPAHAPPPLPPPHHGGVPPAPVGAPPHHGGVPPAPVGAPPPGATAAFPVGGVSFGIIRGAVACVGAGNKRRAPLTTPSPSSLQPFAAPPPPHPPPPARATEISQTATMRNAVNLKKPTLTLTPSPDGGALVVSFAFDASSPAAVSVFWGVAEDAASGCALRPADAASPPAPTAVAVYAAGMGHTFPPADAASARAAGALVDAAVARSLAAGPPAAGGRHALVVRLEAVPGASDASMAASTLAGLTAGAPHTPGVQSQTTFAALEPDAASPAGFTLRVLKQKIWVAGVSYELQEIYGMESAARAAAARSGGGGVKENGAAAAAAAAGAVAAAAATTTTTATTTPSTGDDDEERLCVICLTADRDTTVLPCRHMCMCAPCARELRRQTPRCPICRDTVESLLHIRLGGRGAAGGVATAPALPVAGDGG